MSKKERTLIRELAKRYPQLTLPIEEGMSKTEEYKDVCLRGADPMREPEFFTSPEDEFTRERTPAGEVEVWYLADRRDFVHAYQALACRCEPVKVPDSTGAAALFGLNNWEKVRALTVPVREADKKAYQDRLILLSRGPYSHVPLAMTGLSISEEDWLKASYRIRKYHELTHFISRTLFPENEEAIRDEILADMMGLVHAFGSYSPFLARVFLGTEGERYRKGGRLENYVGEGEDLQAVMKRSNERIGLFLEKMPKRFDDPFEILLCYERERLGL